MGVELGPLVSPAAMHGVPAAMRTVADAHPEVTTGVLPWAMLAPRCLPLLLALLAACSPPVTVATFNIRMFPEPGTDHSLVAERLAELDASVIAVQEIRDARAMGDVLEDASRYTGRD